MKAGWEVKTLGDVCEILDRLRKPITKRNRVSGPYPYYGATGVLDHVEGYLFDEMLVLLGEDGAKWEPGANSAFSIEGKTWVNNHAHVMRPNREVLNDNWLIYYLNFSDLMPFVSGMTVPKLNQGSLREIPIPLPPLAEQKRIVSILDEAFEGLDRARENAEANLKSARELFDASLESTLDPGEKTGWELRTLGEVCSLLNGRAYKKPELLSHGKYPVLRVGNFFTNNNWYFSDLELPEDKYCDNGDLLYAWSASFGPRVWEGGKVIYHYHIWKVEPKAQQIDKRYLYYFFDWDKERIKNEQGAGTTMIHVSKTSMDARKITLPPLEEQKRIVFRLDKVSMEYNSLQVHYRTKLQDISDLRQSLLQKAFAGELT